MNFIKLLLLTLYLAFSYGEEKDANSVLLNVLNNTNNIDQTYSVELHQTQQNKLDKSKKLSIFVQWSDTGKVQKKTRVIVHKPENMKGVSYWEHQFTDNKKQQWMTMPITGKLVEITDKPVNRNEFDLSELELSPKVISNHENSILGNENIFGRECVIVKCVPQNKSIRNPIKKLWIDEEFNIIRKAEFISKTGRILKNISITEIIQIDSLQFPKHIDVFDKKKKINIQLTISDLKLDSQRDELLFTPRKLNYE
jgi:negative regulator of sigma E activity